MATGKVITSVSAGSEKDVDIAVDAALKVRLLNLFAGMKLIVLVTILQGIQNILGSQSTGNRTRKTIEQTRRPDRGKPG
ncbi:hypothetical protein E1B28_005281 [Marasmius oreades]|uniref:Uncharacterized protein n=1 Tax=Marasmius oreades TaxID=181124 RepID=A0A9P7V0A3_9AGAR|nr:uncharacterized protein E1B28_005281 [Marasmius oreades]KAG7097971.1 hypothetical protein E1B28_005281 [Marasmius oreades]